MGCKCGSKKTCGGRTGRIFTKNVLPLKDTSTWNVVRSVHATSSESLLILIQFSDDCNCLGLLSCNWAWVWKSEVK